MEQKFISNGLKAAYDEQYNISHNKWRELCAKYKTLNIIELGHDLNVDKVCEVGAGEGSILMWLEKFKFCNKLYALEISKSGLKNIKQRNLKSLKDCQLFDGYNIPFEDNFFDLVILSHVLEHVEFPRLLLREIKRVSRYQIIEVPLDFSFNVDEKVKHFLSYGHINIYTPTLLRFLLKSEGFNIIDDKLSNMTKDVLKYSLYKNRKKPKTFFSTIKLNLGLLKRKLRIILATKIKRELIANAYTVLCTDSGETIQIMK